MVVEPIRPIKIFYCYAHEDKPLRDELGRHLGPLRRSGWIVEWHDQEIQPGTNWQQEINVHLDTADIVLLLISADFMDSDYCYGVEMQRALERHRAGEAHVIPIILRPTDWEETPIDGLQALPTGGKAVVLWPVRDEAFRDVVRGIRRVTELLRAEEERARQAKQAPVASLVSHPAASAFRHLTPTVTHATRTGLRLLLAKPLVLAVTLTVLVSAGAGIGFFVVPRLSSHPAGSAPARLTYRGHTASVSTVAWSPDGTRVASGSTDHTVQVWDAFTGARLLVYRGHTSYVYAVAWSPDGKRIASGGYDNTVQVWDASTGAKLFTYTGHAGQVNAIAWSPDGNYIASASADHTVQVWNAANGSHVFTYTGHTAPVTAVAWSPDGTRIASGSLDVTVQVWDATTGANVKVYAGHSSYVTAVAWSPDGTRIASGSQASDVQVWDASTTGGKVLTYTGHSGYNVSAVAWSPDGTCIASGAYDRTVQVWDASTGKKLFTYTGHTGQVTAVAWSPDGTRIASGSYDHTVQVWTVG